MGGLPVKKFNRLSNILFCVSAYIFLVAKISYCFIVSPNVVEVILDPTEEHRGKFTIYNDGPDTIRTKITVGGFWDSAASIKNTDRLSREWISISPSQLDIPSKKFRECQFRIKLPKDGKGEYRAEVFFQDVTQKKKNDKALSIAIRYGNTVYAAVKDTEIVKGNISRMQLAGSRPGRFWVVINNQGNVHTRPSGDLRVKNIQTGAEYIIPFNLQRSPVMPNEISEILAKGEINLEPGTYSVTAKVNYGEEYKGKAIKLIREEIFKID